jgi:hypothetical protein
VVPGNQSYKASRPIEPLGDQYAGVNADNMGVDAWIAPGIEDYPVILVATPGLPDWQCVNFAATQAKDGEVTIHFWTVIDGSDDQVTEITLSRDTANWLVEALQVSISQCVDAGDEDDDV